MQRHLALSDGDDSHFGGLLTNPPHWTSAPQPESPPKKKQRASRSVKGEKGKTPEKQSFVECVPKCFDPETGTLVDYIEIE